MTMGRNTPYKFEFASSPSAKAFLMSVVVFMDPRDMPDPMCDPMVGKLSSLMRFRPSTQFGGSWLANDCTRYSGLVSRASDVAQSLVCGIGVRTGGCSFSGESCTGD